MAMADAQEQDIPDISTLIAKKQLTESKKYNAPHTQTK